MSKKIIKQFLTQRKKSRLLLTAWAVLVLSMLYIVFGNPGRSSAAAGCTALPTTYGAVAVSNVSVPSSGTYHVWSRIKTADTTNNSFLFQTDNNCNIVIGDSASIPANSWTWIDYKDGNTATKADVTLTAGTHPMEIAGREDNVLVDRILIISDTCIPTGTGDNCVIASDTSPPTVSLTAPSAGATVNGSAVNFAANASDDTSIAGVQFKVDGTNTGPEDTSSPYSVSWDSTSVSNGVHTVTAAARDIAGNTTTSDAVIITVDNSSAPGGTLLLGTQTVQPVDDSNASGDGEAFKYTAVATGKAGTLSFYLSSGNAATTLKVGLYSDNGGHPGTLLTSGSTTSPVADSWTTVNLSPAVTISSGTSYWIGFLPTGGTMAYRDLSTGSCSENYASGGQTTLPATWSSGPSWPTCNASAYVLAAASGPKPGDINNDNNVNITDLSLLLSSYNQNVTQCVTNNSYKCDLSSPPDNVVNIFDLSILLSHYGT